MKVLTVHGIRLNNRWYEKFEVIPEIKESNIELVFFEYGFFRFDEFLIPCKREKIIDKFCEFYSDQVQNSDFPPAVIAHSFGTYIVYMAMKRYESIKFSSIIFCGSILNSKSDFRSFFERKQVLGILNDHGNREWFLRYTRYIINKYCGRAGEIGFTDVPPKYSNVFVNRDNYQRHSDYFLPKHMKDNWLPKLLQHRYQTDYKVDILSQKVIERIYSNITQSKIEFDIDEISFNARVDAGGNYYAKYEIKGKNNTNKIIDNYDFVTTADGLNKEENMNFVSYDHSNKQLFSTFENDRTHYKKIKVHLENPIYPKQQVYLKNYFCWHGTIDLKSGDTDHWAIKGISNIKIQLNFPSELKSVRLYEIKDREIVGQNLMTIVTEKDNSITYIYSFLNNRNLDGLIFYFEGVKNLKNQRIKVNTIKVPLLNTNYSESKHLKDLKRKKIGSSREVFITRASLTDLKRIYKLEVDIEYSNAASEETIRDRINMFNDGFLVIKDNNDKIYGYIESIIWNQKPFNTFSEISNFPMHYNIKGDSLYVIFLAVEKNSRRKGYATKLLAEIEKVATRYLINRVRLVAKDDLIHFYSKNGYHSVKELPDFLKSKKYKSVLMEKILMN